MNSRDPEASAVAARTNRHESDRPQNQVGDEVAELAARLRLSVTRLARRLRQEAEIGLSPTLLSSLAVISNHGPLTLGHLAEIENVSPPTITKIAKRLEAAGLVERITDADDRRVRYVECTELGHELLQTSRERKNAWLAGKLDELTPDDRDAITAALEALERMSTAGPR